MTQETLIRQVCFNKANETKYINIPKKSTLLTGDYVFIKKVEEE